MGYLKRNSNGCLSYNFIKNSAQIKKEDNDQEKTVSIGNLSEGLQPNSYSMSSFIEEKKNSTKPSKILFLFSFKKIKSRKYLSL